MHDEHEIVARLDISPQLVNIEAARKDAGDLSWEHAKEFANELGFGIGSDEFVDIFNQLNSRYEHQVEHLKFFMLTALITMREMLQNNLIALPLEEDRQITEEEAVEYITAAAQCLVGSYMWISASHELFWPEDDSISEDTAVSFYFDVNDVLFPEEE